MGCASPPYLQASSPLLQVREIDLARPLAVSWLAHAQPLPLIYGDIGYIYSAGPNSQVMHRLRTPSCPPARAVPIQ